eukprot:scaffold492_cov99-Amphora_coffeaeformis.AAC.1
MGLFPSLLNFSQGRGKMNPVCIYKTCANVMGVVLVGQIVGISTTRTTTGTSSTSRALTTTTIRAGWRR